MDKTNDMVNDTANDIEMLLNEKRKQYRACQSKSRAGSTPYASKRKKKRKKRK
nr:hypothetical protein [uncultured Prevotella sp.]